MILRHWTGWYRTILVALAGGAVFEWIGMPLSWMLGPMTAILIWKEVLRKQASWSAKPRNFALVVLGFMTGRSFTPEVAIQIGHQLPSMLAVTVLTVAFGLGLGWISHRLTGASLGSNLLGSIPGSLTNVVVLSEEIKGVDSAYVAFMQTIRKLTVMFAVPLLTVYSLAGAWTAPIPVANPADSADEPAVSLLQALFGEGRWTGDGWWFLAAICLSVWLAPKLHLPTPQMLGPVIVTAMLTSCGLHPPVPPPVVTYAAQVLMGVHLGMVNRLGSLSGWRKLLPIGLAGSMLLVLFTSLAGWLLALWHGIDLASAFLSTAPGGMAEMSVVGASIGADTSVIVSYQLFRLLFIYLVVPPFVKWLLKAAGRTAPHHP